MSNVSASRLEENRTLRSEILAKQGQRVQVLAFNVAAFGAIIVATAQKAIEFSLSNPTEGALIVLSGSVGHFAVLVPSIYFTIRHSQQISKIGIYIIQSIESKDEGLHWHTYWRHSPCTTGEDSIGTHLRRPSHCQPGAFASGVVLRRFVDPKLLCSSDHPWVNIPPARFNPIASLQIL